ncbi:hypothetical protein GGX14DRAFT_576584 [Mycena pura]|uniref:Uncharacterized protein n=1 Tax=Mycena pura TaxID=153505 RepID=A0AAD6UX19_9AGAR|nr:hypothetical protein GGX14DRAFT_576584 [Mycena pura]
MPLTVEPVLSEGQIESSPPSTDSTSRLDHTATSSPPRHRALVAEAAKLSLSSVFFFHRRLHPPPTSTARNCAHLLPDTRRAAARHLRQLFAPPPVTAQLPISSRLPCLPLASAPATRFPPPAAYILRLYILPRRDAMAESVGQSVEITLRVKCRQGSSSLQYAHAPTLPFAAHPLARFLAAVARCPLPVARRTFPVASRMLYTCRPAHSMFLPAPRSQHKSATCRASLCPNTPCAMLGTSPSRTRYQKTAARWLPARARCRFTLHTSRCSLPLAGSSGRTWPRVLDTHDPPAPFMYVRLQKALASRTTAARTQSAILAASACTRNAHPACVAQRVFTPRRGQLPFWDIPSPNYFPFVLDNAGSMALSLSGGECLVLAPALSGTMFGVSAFYRIVVATRPSCSVLFSSFITHSRSPFCSWEWIEMRVPAMAHPGRESHVFGGNLCSIFLKIHFAARDAFHRLTSQGPPEV